MNTRHETADCTIRPTIMAFAVRLGRSLLRIIVVAAILAGIGVAVLAIALRQPALTSLSFKGSLRADPVRLLHHVTFLTDDVRPRSASHPENLDRAARYIADRFRAANGATSVQTFSARGNEYSNVIARWGSSDPKLPVLIIGAHYDAFSANDDLPGADDNASGTAGLLELARLLGEHPVTSPVLLVAYTTEEPPFFGSEEMGSAVHAKSMSAERQPVRGMISLEMIGYFSHEQSWPNALFELLYPSTGDFIGVVGGWPDRSLARFVKRAIAGSGGVPVVSFRVRARPPTPRIIATTGVTAGVRSSSPTPRFCEIPTITRASILPTRSTISGWHASSTAC
ncbi:MAG: M28 family peptidase [Acidobacteriota bacterium]|nr:M28 family peptidase [Acidobacteriota bacterium]